MDDQCDTCEPSEIDDWNLEAWWSILSFHRFIKDYIEIHKII